MVSTVLNGRIVPAVILHEHKQANGGTVYDVVDGKQRLVTLYTFWTGAGTNDLSMACGDWRERLPVLT